MRTESYGGGRLASCHDPRTIRDVALGFPGGSSGKRITPFIAASTFLFLLHSETKKSSSPSALRLGSDRRGGGGVRVPL